MPEDHRAPYDMEEVIVRIVDADDYLEFQPEHAPEMLCANARLCGLPGRNDRQSARISENHRRAAHRRHRVHGIGAQGRVLRRERRAARMPLLYLQDVSGFMVGMEAESEGIIRAGAEMVETMACATVPKIVLTLNHASGAGYYAMAGQGFDPQFHVRWPTARIGVMEGDSAVKAITRPNWTSTRRGKPIPAELQGAIEKTRADYERWLDASYAAARGHVDAMIDPLATREVLTLRSIPRPTADGTARRERVIRIANGRGFWGDWLEAPVRLVEQGPIDYLDTGLPGRSHHVDPAEAETAGSEPRLCARFSAPDRSYGQLLL